MSSLLARTGRHRQRYENEFRLVAGCIPYRLKKSVGDHTVDLENRLEVLMISSPNRVDLVFPKGGWENDETVYQAACREAMEEAGVKGELDKNRLGIWEFRSKSRQNSCSLEGWCRGYMFALEVTEELDTWPEEHNHGRRWLTVTEAFGLCRYDWMHRALEQFRLSVVGKYQTKEESVVATAMPVPEVVAEHSTLKTSCFVKPQSGTQQLSKMHCVERMNHVANPLGPVANW